MKIAIISDIHGCLHALEQTLAQLEPWRPDHYVLLGDILNHGPRNPVPEGYNPAAVAECLNRVAPYAIAVRGNCDSEVDQMLLQFPIMAPYNHLLVDGRRWFVTHGHLYTPSEVALPRQTLFISGHTHLPILERQGDVIVVNPGSICFPRGQLPASYGCYEKGVMSIKAVADSQELLRMEI